MSQAYEIRSVMQAGADPPVITEPNKPRMTGEPPQPRSAGTPPEYMPGADPLPRDASQPAFTAPPSGEHTPPSPPSERPPARPEARGTGERYVRLRMRVDGDEMRVVGAKVVEGPLLSERTLQPGLVYEAAVGDTRVNSGSLDAGILRSTPPEPDPDGLGHHIARQASYEFTVRIPQEELREEDLARLRIALYRTKGPPPTGTPAPGPLLRQYPRELRPVAELNGVKLDDLSERVQGEMRNALKR